MNQSPEQYKSDNTEQQTDLTMPSKLSRRAFLSKTSVAALPVVMSMKSGDAWGCVGLSCDFGTTNLSGTKSAVASAQTTQGSSYVVPKWSSISNIKNAVKADFGRDIDGVAGFLLKHYDFGYTRAKNSSGVYVYTKLSTTYPDVNSWLAQAKSKAPLGKFFLRASNGSYSSYTDTAGLLSPAHYNGAIITGQTNMGAFFADMAGITVWAALSSTNNFVKYVTAAFVGSIWQDHPVWQQSYSRGIATNPNCYPNTSEIIKAYNTVINVNAKTHPQGKTGALADMGNLFAMYTKAG